MGSVPSVRDIVGVLLALLLATTTVVSTDRKHGEMIQDLRSLNWGLILGSAQVCLCFSAGIGYCFVKDWKHATYFVLAAAITAVVTWWF